MPKRTREKLRIHIYGVDSTPDPYPGVGIARSLRLAFPGCELVAVDRSANSSGLCWPDFDSWLILPTQSDLVKLCGSLGSNEYLLPCEDEAIYRFSVAMKNNRQLLSPPVTCVRFLRKPARHLAKLLRVHIPSSLLLPASRRGLENFLEQNGSIVWRKGRIAGAQKVSVQGTDSLRNLISRGSRHRQAELLQVNIEGSLEVLAFAAYRGQFLHGVWMHKQRVTSKGKTWSGNVTRLSKEWRARLQSVSRQLSWSGGGALEFIRDKEDQLWLIDANPRFPAWIHGATLCGINLPGELLTAASGQHSSKCVSTSRAFSRVVVEVAVRPQLECNLRSEIVD